MRPNEPRHDKTNNAAVRPAKTQISLGICPVWSESSLSAWRKLGPLPTHWVHSKDSNQTGHMPRLIWVFAGCTLILLVLSCHGSNNDLKEALFYTYQVGMIGSLMSYKQSCWNGARLLVFCWKRCKYQAEVKHLWLRILKTRFLNTDLKW